MNVLNALYTCESSVSFILDPSCVSIDADWVIVVIVTAGAEIEEWLCFGEKAVEFELPWDDFGQHKIFYVLNFLFIFMIILID